jgi:hypothetical protein
VTFSFPVPLSSTLDAAHVIYDPVGGGQIDPTNCPGTAASPDAASGYMCVYESAASNGPVPSPTLIGFFGTAFLPADAGFAAAADKSGTVLYYSAPSAGTVQVNGNWAVTG